MIISPAFLRQGLLGLVSLSGSVFDSPELVLNYPRFLCNGEIPEEHRIYFAADPAVPLPEMLPAGSVFFLPHDTPARHISDRLVLLPPDVQMEAVFNRVCEIFEHWNQFRNELGELIDRRAPVDEILAFGAEELGNPIYLHDSRYELLACSDEDSLLEPERLGHLIRALNLDPQYRELEQSRDHFQIPPSVSEFSFFCCNSYSDKTVYDYRIVMPDLRRSFTTADESAFRLLCSFIRRAMSRPGEQQRLLGGSSGAAGLRSMFQEALTQAAPEYQRLSRELTQFGWLPEHRYCVLVSHVTRSDAETHAATLLCQQFERKLPHSSAQFLSGQIVVVLNLSLNEKSLDQLLHEAVFFLRDNFLKLGISNAAVGLSEIRSRYSQARIALDHIQQGGSYSWRMHFRDMTLSYILSNCTGELSPRAVCSEKLLQLQKYDAEHHTDLCNTLRCYIECRFNALETTRRLFIHRSTFLYRLERIRELFGIDLEDPDELLHIMISFRLLEQE